MVWSLFIQTNGFGFWAKSAWKCVAKNMSKEKQCTLLWYVDDNKLFIMKDEVWEYIIAKVAENCGELSIQCGKKTVFIGMDIEITDDGKVKIGMQEYIKETIECFDEDASTPVASASFRNFTKIKETEPLN